MKIRKATAQEMLTLWGYRSYSEATPTAHFFADNLMSGNAEFWTVDISGELIGELYVFKSLTDTDFADGTQRVYLCAFRIRKDHRGKGIGSCLMQAVLTHLKESGYGSVTIGVEEAEESNIRLYKRFGFDTKIKDCYVDPCAMGCDMLPQPCPCFWLLCKNLGR